MRMLQTMNMDLYFHATIIVQYVANTASEIVGKMRKAKYGIENK